MTKAIKLKALHKNYSIYTSDSLSENYYSDGVIESLKTVCNGDESNDIIVRYRSGEVFNWKTKYIDVYNMSQFGIAVSFDGTKVFAQTWENGLLCFDAKTGKCIWKTKSKRGITNIVVNDDTVTVQVREYAMQLLDINTGEVIKEKKPSKSWGFTTLDNRHLICETTSKKWEIIEAQTLEVKETFREKELTSGKKDCCINHLTLGNDGIIHIKASQMIWDETEKELRYYGFENFVRSEYFSKK